MGYKKPTTGKLVEKMQNFARYMLAKNDYVTKQELMEHFEIKNERTVRDIISEMSHRIPILSTSDKAGYKIARTYADLNEIEHMWREIDSRIEELEKRKKPLMDLYNKLTKINIGD